MPSEQGQGRPRPSSDLYALGMIGIQALTGLNPMQLSENTQTGEIIWRHQAQVSDNLAAILNKMVRHYFKHRYQSATEALQAVNSLTHAKTPMAVAAALSQKGHSYLKSGYQSASQTLRSLASLAKTYISQNNATSLPFGTPENTVTMPPAHLSNSPNASQATLGSVFKGPYKLPLLIGAGTATVVVAIGAISAMRQPPPSPKTAQNPTELKEIKPEQADTTKQATQPSNTDPSSNPTQPINPAQPNNNCIVVVKSSNVRSLSGRGKTKDVVKAGTPVSVTGKEEGGWIEINSPVSGWIWKSRTKNTCSSR
jgi:serine/threonine-protein kinase